MKRKMGDKKVDHRSACDNVMLCGGVVCLSLWEHLLTQLGRVNSLVSSAWQG